jgi:hypothetical protein
MSLNPSPPICFRLHISFRETQHVFISPSQLPHKSFLSIELICSHSPLLLLVV